MGYSLALVLMKPPVRNYREFHEWLETKSTDLRLRDYDVVLQWSNDEILVILPGVDQDLTHDRLRERFRDLLNRNNWQEVPFGVLVSQGDDLTPDQIAHLLRDDMQIHDMGNQES
jgi:GGDEF domain-containing protein